MTIAGVRCSRSRPPPREGAAARLFDRDETIRINAAQEIGDGGGPGGREEAAERVEIGHA